MTTFTAFALAHGVEIGDLFASDRIRRCPTTAHPKSRNGAYWFDGSRGWVQNWEHGDSVQWWNDITAKPWTEADKSAWLARRKTAEAERIRNQQRAADRAATLIATARQDTHGYLRARGFPDHKGLVIDDGRILLVPMRDVSSNALLGTQQIFLENNCWEKKMLPGMRAKGAVFLIGSRRARETWLVEGYATGLSVAAAIHQLRMDASVTVCFSAQNLIHIAGLLKGRRFVFADNDQSGTGARAAEATGLPWTMSPTLGDDANDLHQRAGLLAVARLLMETRT